MSLDYHWHRLAILRAVFCGNGGIVGARRVRGEHVTGADLASDTVCQNETPSLCGGDNGCGRGDVRGWSVRLAED